MVGGTLRELRERIADCHEEGGRYYVSCARTGERPVPVADKRFPDRETAAEAAEAAAAYRAELRHYDPRLPCYDLVVSEDPGVTAPEPAVEDPPNPDAPEGSMDFCHDVAAAVFEALSALGERDVERAAMDAYLHSAEAVTDPDDLCLVLLSTMATELDARLDPDRQGEVLRAAADRLGTDAATDDPVDAALARFDGLSLVGGYAVAAGPDVGDGRSWTITLDDYAFDRAEGRLPTLPLAVELLRYLPDRTLAVTDVRSAGEGSWECVVTAGAASAAGVASAHLRE